MSNPRPYSEFKKPSQVHEKYFHKNKKWWFLLRAIAERVALKMQKSGKNVIPGREIAIRMGLQVHHFRKLKGS